MARIAAYSKEAKEIAFLVDSLPPAERRYLIETVFRVGAAARARASVSAERTARRG